MHNYVGLLDVELSIGFGQNIHMVSINLMLIHIGGFPPAIRRMLVRSTIPCDHTSAPLVQIQKLSGLLETSTLSGTLKAGIRFGDTFTSKCI